MQNMYSASHVSCKLWWGYNFTFAHATSTQPYATTLWEQAPTDLTRNSLVVNFPLNPVDAENP